PGPRCSGDATANDGLAGGTCAGGADAGAACDANGEDASFPVSSGGGSYSYDCLPSVNLTGVGMEVDGQYVTGSSALAPAALACGVGEQCPCGVCDQIPQETACSSNADCAGQPNTCSGSKDDFCTSN